jgi:RND family efflux transporter MFP subunit
MATQSAAFSTFLPEFAAGLLSEREVYPRARIIATQVSRLLPGSAVIVYVLEEGNPQTWGDRATVGQDLSVAAPSLPCDAGTLGLVWKRKQPFVLSGASLRREDYAHLNVRRTLASLAYYPLFRDKLLIGAVEIISFEHPIDADVLASLSSLTDHAALALSTAVAYEDERNSQFKTINRLTQLYDLERVFNSTLRMNELLPIIAAKIQEILEVQAVNLWMVHDDDMLLMNRSGEDSTIAVGAVQATGEGIAAEVADSAKALLLPNSSDPRLVSRNSNAQGTPIRSLVAVPIVSQDSLVGVLEIINRLDGKLFDEDDAFFLSTISLTAASALHNASLLEAERKIEILETLVKVSQEITSTLNLDRVLAVVVNGPQAIMAYDRAAIALDDRGKLQIKAISGKTEIIQSDPAVRLLREMLEFCAISDSETYVAARGNQVQADRAETRVKFANYFSQSGSRAWYAIPLQDDEGRLGILSFESKNPEFLSDVHLELIKVLAAQATVAVRNASLYTEVPFIGILEPLLQKKQQFMRMEKSRRTAALILAATVVLFLAFFPLPMRVDGAAVVAPQRTAQIQAELEGVIKNVLVREGDPVKRGTVLAEMDDWNFRSALAGAQAKHDSAVSQTNRALASNDGAEAGIQRVQADYWASEVSRARERLERTRLRSPIDGVVATPHVEDLVGRKLDVGDNFAQVLDTSRASIDIAVDQGDLPLVHAGEPASLKLEGFPTGKLRGDVVVVSPLGVAEGERRVFMARVHVLNSDGTLRAGMQGRGKVSVGWRPAGYVMFRGLGMWAWTKLWTWFGW